VNWDELLASVTEGAVTSGAAIVRGDQARRWAYHWPDWLVLDSYKLTASRLRWFISSR